MLLATFSALPACKKPDSSTQPTANANLRKDRYTVRGQVAMLPTPGNPASEFQVRHEAIPHFVGQDGELGMDTMTMPFPLADGLVLPSVKVGDKVELTFEVDYDTALKQLTGYRAVGATILPPETELDFSSIKRWPAYEKKPGDQQY